MHYVTRIMTTPAMPSRHVRPFYQARTSCAQLLLGFALSFAVVPLAATAQAPGDTARGQYQPDALSTGPFASRASLQEAAKGTGPTALIAQERVASGDFQVGDRIALAVAGEPTLTDTFTVREGQLIRLPNIPDVRLHGVLHAELQDTLTRYLGHYIKDPVVHASPLVRVAVLGQVPRPGWYSVAADELATSVFMHAGGLINSSDLGKTKVRRGSETLYTPKALQVAMTNGETVDQLALHPGDEIVVGERPPGGSLVRYLGVAAILAGLAGSIAIIATR
jgi:protein involved in polysaccharide export with SLBB domain